MKRKLKTFDKPGNVNRLLMVFYLSLLVLLVIDFFIHKHSEFPWEGAPVFYAVYGFAACISVIFIAKLLRLFVKRDEDYYKK